MSQWGAGSEDPETGGFRAAPRPLSCFGGFYAHLLGQISFQSSLLLILFIILISLILFISSYISLSYSLHLSFLLSLKKRKLFMELPCWPSS